MLPGFAPYLEHFTRLFPGAGLRVTATELGAKRRNDELAPDAELEVRLDRRVAKLHVLVKRTHLATTVAHALAGALGDHAPGWILFVPYVGRPLGGFLAEHGLNYVDLSGNCHLRVADRLVAHVEGRAPAKAIGRPKGVRAAGVRALFALLADPDRLTATGRDVARAAATTHPTAMDAVRRLEQAGAVVIDGRQRRWMPGGLRIALERWLDEYETVLRPTLVVGAYRTPDRTPPELDRRIAEMAATGAGVRFGGAAAAYRVAPHHRGERTVVHVAHDERNVLRLLRAVPDSKGTLLVLRLPGPHAQEGPTPDVVHPLLIYAELLHAADDRTLEAAQVLRERALGDYA